MRLRDSRCVGPNGADDLRVAVHVDGRHNVGLDVPATGVEPLGLKERRSSLAQTASWLSSDAPASSSGVASTVQAPWSQRRRQAMRSATAASASGSAPQSV